MRLEDIVDESLHSKSLVRRIRALQSEYVVKGTLQSGSYLQALNDLLLDDADEFFKEEQEELLNKVKSHDCEKYEEVNDILKILDLKIQGLFNKYFTILHDQAINLVTVSEEHYTRILEELAFKENLERKRDKALKVIEADYMVYQERKKIERATLAAAKSSQKATWLFGSITVIISIIAYFTNKL